MSQNQPDVVAAAMVTELSFLACLEGQFLYSLRRCHVTLTYLFSSEVTTTNNFNGQLLGKCMVLRYEFSNHNEPHQCNPFHPQGFKYILKCQKIGYSHFQIIKLCSEGFPINHFQRQSYLHMFKRKCEQMFEINVDLLILQGFQYILLTDANALCFKQLYFSNINIYICSTELK